MRQRPANGTRVRRRARQKFSTLLLPGSTLNSMCLECPQRPAPDGSAYQGGLSYTVQIIGNAEATPQRQEQADLPVTEQTAIADR